MRQLFLSKTPNSRGFLLFLAGLLALAASCSAPQKNRQSAGSAPLIPMETPEEVSTKISAKKPRRRQIQAPALSLSPKKAALSKSSPFFFRQNKKPQRRAAAASPKPPKKKQNREPSANRKPRSAAAIKSQLPLTSKKTNSLSPVSSSLRGQPYAPRFSPPAGKSAKRRQTRDPFAPPDIFTSFAGKSPPPSAVKPFPFIKNREVKKWIRFFARPGKTAYTKLWLKRSYRYIPLMKGILRSHGLPEELAYMTLVESSLSPRAVSSAKAVGYWQFIKPTALRFGLQVNDWLDERRDFQKSAAAASRYLLLLHTEFQDWLLAMSAYNMGEARLRKLVNKHKSRNFWILSRKPDFPGETASYIPKILAAAHIMRTPELYGFRRFAILTPYKYDIFYVPGGTDLKKMFKGANLPLVSLKTLNPELKKSHIPKSVSKHKLRIPKGSGKFISGWLKTRRPQNSRQAAKK